MHDLSSLPADRWNAHDEAGASSRNIPVGVVARQPWTEHFAKIVAAQGLDTIFASPRWLAALADTYGFAVQASTLTVDGRVVAAIPYCDIEDIGGRRIVSLPFSDYVDPFVQSAAEWNALTAPLLAYNLPIRFRCLR